MKKLTVLAMALSMLAAVGCTCKKTVTDCEPNPEIQQKVDEYAEFALTSDLINTLSHNEKELVKIFIEIGQVMDEIYWDQYFGYANRDAIDTLCVGDVKRFEPRYAVGQHHAVDPSLGIIVIVHIIVAKPY